MSNQDPPAKAAKPTKVPPPNPFASGGGDTRLIRFSPHSHCSYINSSFCARLKSQHPRISQI
jgi:hypothetical protein